MMRQIKESDWKIFKPLREIALDRFCQRTLSEIDRISEDTTKGAHEKYLEIYALLRSRDKEIAQIFDSLRRSTAYYQILAIKRFELLTEEEFARFSEETRGLITSLLAL